jgi:hypothetical protein
MDSADPLLPPRLFLRTPRTFRLLVAATLALFLACSSAARPITSTGRVAPTTGDPSRTYALSQVFLLGIDSLPPRDTTVRVKRGAARVIVIRHPAPDDLTFGELALPAQAFDSTGPDSVNVDIRIRRGVYGLDLTTSAPLRAATLTFKYAVHFAAPAEARRTFGSDVAFERVLAIGKLGPGETIVFQRSTRPATDNLATALTAAGSYVVGAPK